MKSYVSPIVSFESFELTSNTANTCGKPVHLLAKDVCGAYVPEVGNVFLSGIEGCEYTGADGEYSICYHNPDDAHSLFNS